MKKRAGLILSGLLLIPCAARTQSGPTLSGTVSEKGTGRPLEGAKVVVVGGKANSESTDTNGAFILKFPAEVRVGDLIRIHIELEGYIPYTDTVAVAPAQPHSVSLERIKTNSKIVTKPDATRRPVPTIVFRDQIPDVFTIELHKGSRAIISRKDLTEKGWGPFQMGDERPFSIHLDNGNLYAEARIYNGPDLPAVEVNKGDFIVRPMDWDRNFSDNALEIVNERMQPVLQIIYKRNGLIQIQGIFRGRNGATIFEAPELPEALPRIFKYPSWKYQGQYAEAADQDASPFARATDLEFVEFVRKWLEEPKRLLQSSNHDPAVVQVVAQNLMIWFYEKGVLYRGELVRRLKDKGDKETARLKTPPDSQAVLSLSHTGQIESMSKILVDIDSLTIRLVTKKAEDFANHPLTNNAMDSSASSTKEFHRPVDQVDVVAQHHEPEDSVAADVRTARASGRPNPKVSAGAVTPVELRGFVFFAEGCERLGESLSCSGSVKNRMKRRALDLNAQTEGISTVIDNRGTQYRLVPPGQNTLVFGDSGRRQDLETDLPISFTVTVQNFSPSAASASLLLACWTSDPYGFFNVTLRNVPITSK